jgi:aminopeptidase N
MQKVSRLIQSFTPDHYNLSLTLNRKERTFNGTVTIEGTSQQDKSLRVHAKDLTIETVLVDGREATFAMHENDELEISQNSMLADSHIVVIGFSGKITDQMHGLYPCYFEHDDVKKELLATQFESHHAREVFPCVDEPEAKATFDVALTTEKNITVLGNMPVKLQREENNALVTIFDTTPRMSSYLLAWVTGELHSKTAKTSQGVEVNAWATPAQDPASLDFALDIAVRATEFYNQYFGIDYPLPKCDHVALPDFSSGAMENWGLITYREATLLADMKTTSISSRHYIATVITHELAHQWFGNLVTMKWWNNLWLNESFANLMEYIAVDALHPEWNIWLDYSSHETIMALRRDAMPGVQAVQVEVNHPDEISTLFDGAIVYAKGGRLLRMLQHYVGHTAFQAGLKSYFKKYAYKNTEGNDLWYELSEASGKDIAQFMNTWISQSGYPVVHVEKDMLRQEQFFVGEPDQSNKIWSIPLEPSVSITPLVMESATTNTTLMHGERLNVGDAAHFITHYSSDHLASLVEQVKSGTFEPLDRLQLLHEQTMLARGGVISTAELIPLLQSYRQETAESVWDIMALSLGELKKFVESNQKAEDKLRALSATISSNQYEHLGWSAKQDEPETDTKLRATILGMTLYGQSEDVLQTANGIFDSNSLQDIDPELRGLIIGTKVRYYETDELIDMLINTYKKSSSSELQSDISSGLTSSKNPETIKRLLDNMKDSSVVRSQDVFRWFVYLIRGRDSRSLAWSWVQHNWKWVEETFGGDKSFDDFPRYAASGLSTREQLEEYKTFFTPMMDIPALKRVITIGIAEIEARVELIEHDSPAVHSMLLDQ